jgi:hypothetical protein
MKKDHRNFKIPHMSLKLSADKISPDSKKSPVSDKDSIKMMKVGANSLNQVLKFGKKSKLVLSNKGKKKN